MNAPKRPPRSDSWPSAQSGQARGLLPSALGGNSIGSRNLSSSAVMSDGFCSMISAVLGLKSFQKASSTSCHWARPPVGEARRTSCDEVLMSLKKKVPASFDAVASQSLNSLRSNVS